MKSIKVLHIVSVEKENYYLNNLADYTDASEVDYSFVTFAGDCDFVKDMKSRGRRVYFLDGLRRNQYPSLFFKLWKLIKTENPDIVHTHLFDPTVIGLTIAKWQKRKAIFTRHHSDAVHEISSEPKRKFYLGLEKYVNRKADHIIAPSQMVRDILIEKENVPPEKVSLIPYGQTTGRFDTVTDESVTKVRTELEMNGHLSLACISRLFHRKGHKYLFDAFSALLRAGVQAKLYLVGEGDYKDTLNKMASDLQIAPHVKFLGWRDDALSIIAASDIIVHPSLEDALSSAVIESLMLERPVIATDISGVRDILDNGKYGRIVAPSDSDSIYNALCETIENLETARQKAKNGRSYLLEYMDAKKGAESHQKIYRRLIG